MVAPNLMAAELFALLLLLALLLEELLVLLLADDWLLDFAEERLLAADFAVTLLVRTLAELAVKVPAELKLALAFELAPWLRLDLLAALLAIVGLFVRLPTELLDNLGLIFVALEFSVLILVADELLASIDREDEGF